ncbi:hypothetical protein JTE90_025288 [Oedothorax gibbosus]|uniref:Uncharacterized protein n=1 Tax=Oedothorax gibbosus TaxID=931172 RepID=A0AAV6TIR2_9ARAC|nr:hypothetical protein JTE90_025288 [Oedothorax gibbosus]
MSAHKGFLTHAALYRPSPRRRSGQIRALARKRTNRIPLVTASERENPAPNPRSQGVGNVALGVSVRGTDSAGSPLGPGLLPKMGEGLAARFYPDASP